MEKEVLQSLNLSQQKTKQYFHFFIIQHHLFQNEI